MKVLLSWPSLISNILVAYNGASDWPRTFLHPGCFCLAYMHTYKATGNNCSAVIVALFCLSSIIFNKTL